MSNTTVYRVQDASGNGPYAGFIAAGLCEGVSFPWTTRNHSTDPNTPEPLYDFGVDDVAAWYSLIKQFGPRAVKFGFDSLQALHNWFTNDELEELRDWGFSVVAIPAQALVVSKSGKQCVFVAADL